MHYTVSMDMQKSFLSLARKTGSIRTSDLVKEWKISRQYAQRVLSTAVEEGLLVKIGSTRSSIYVLPEHANKATWTWTKKYVRQGLAEHVVLEEIKDVPGFRQSLPDRLLSIFDYAFSEMLNNAIEHSESRRVHVTVEKRKNTFCFQITDTGIGVFRNIMKKRRLQSELEAIQDLLKGKTTTQPQAHSGEGIFFTSKVADIFTLESFGTKLTIDNLTEDIVIENIKPARKGTTVSFQIASDSPKHLSEIFKKFQTDPEEHAFDKTEIQIKLYTLGTVHVSRSQARRVLSGLEKFRTIIFDFERVPTIGQAFADEIFRVFKHTHPSIQLIPKNMNETVRFWVERVGK